VMTLDIEMPGINGVEFLKQLIPQYPIPVVMVSGVNEAIFDALDAGAVDLVNKPDATRHENLDAFLNEMIMKIKIASTAKVGRFKKDLAIKPLIPAASNKSNDMIIAIGASTGGTEAIVEVIESLPDVTPGIVIVQHMPKGFTKMYADRLNRICKMAVMEAKDGDEVKNGRVLVAPGGFQLMVIKNALGYSLRIFEGEKVNGHQPSIDMMFNSVADTAKGSAIGVILTGMGNDGARGLLKMRQNGAYTIGQDEKSCVVYGMPKVAFDLGAVKKQCSLSVIENEILRYLRSRNVI